MSNKTDRPAGPDPARILEMASAFYASAVLFAASDLGIFAALERMKKADSGRVARECGLDPRGAELLMNGCASLGLLNKDGAEFSNTPDTSVFLVPGSPGDLSRAIRYNRDVYSAWGKVSELARTGRPVEAPGIHLGADPARTRSFVMAMHGRAMGIGRAVVPCLNLKGRKKLLDVGGGPGTYSVLIAKANPEIRCTVLDLPDVVKIASELIAMEDTGGRVETLAGDYHTAAFPAGNDVVNFFGVLHQEPPDVIRNLFKKAFDAMAPGGLINVLDMMTDRTHTKPRFSALFAVNMALTTENGWVFSDAEIEEWLTEAGFRHFECRPVPPPMPHWLATAIKE